MKKPISVIFLFIVLLVSGCTGAQMHGYSNSVPRPANMNVKQWHKVMKDRGDGFATRNDTWPFTAVPVFWDDMRQWDGR